MWRHHRQSRAGPVGKYEIESCELADTWRGFGCISFHDHACGGLLAVYGKAARGRGQTIAALRDQKRVRRRAQESRGDVEKSLPRPLPTGRKLRRISLNRRGHEQ